MLTRSKAKAAKKPLDATKKDKGTKRSAASSPGDKTKPTKEARVADDINASSKPIPVSVTPKKSKTKKVPTVRMSSAALRPRRNEGETFYLRDLKVIYAPSEDQRPSQYVECVNFHKEDIFGHGGENLNRGFQVGCCVYLVPLWTDKKELANVTGFEIVATEVEDRSRPNLYAGIPGMYVYLMPKFDPGLEDRIIGLQLYRSRKYNPPNFGWSHSTVNINQGRGGDNLYLQWDLGGDQDLPGHKFRFRFWRR